MMTQRNKKRFTAFLEVPIEIEKLNDADMVGFDGSMTRSLDGGRHMAVDGMRYCSMDDGMRYCSMD